MAPVSILMSRGRARIASHDDDDVVIHSSEAFLQIRNNSNI